MDHIAANREAWTTWSGDYVEPGRRSWSTDEISWGIWSIPEADIGALPPLKGLEGRSSIELGCGTAYFSAWLWKRGLQPVGLDVTPAQLSSARALQVQFGIDFPLILASAEDVPLRDASFDLAVSEYGASIWCDPEAWISEAGRLVRPNGHLVFLRNSTVSLLCTAASGPDQEALRRDYFSMYRFEWEDDIGVEFHLPFGPMLRLLRKHGFELEDFIEIQAPLGATSRYDHITPEWANKWPSEEIWRLRRR